MGESTDQIERDIHATRSDLGRNLDELEDKARDLVDWRTHYRDHSDVFLGAAFGVGFVLGLATVPRPQPGARRGTYDSSLGRHPADPSHALWSGTGVRAKRQMGETWEQISDAILGVLSAKAVQVVGDLVPGFRDHLRGSQRFDDRGPDRSGMHRVD